MPVPVCPVKYPSVSPPRKNTRRSRSSSSRFGRRIESMQLRYACTTAETYETPFIRPSIFKDATPISDSCSK